MDLTESIEPRSDQLNADDLITGPITVTIRDVIKGKAEQPFDFLLEETNRAYRPSKTMRRVIVSGWGPLTPVYVGRQLTLYREPSVTFGGKRVGGIQISHMSHLSAGPLTVPAQTTRGQREEFVVQPLTTAAPAPAESPFDVVINGFAGMGVTTSQLEAHVALPRADWDDSILNALRTLGGEISRGEKAVADLFEVQS